MEKETLPDWETRVALEIERVSSDAAKLLAFLEEQGRIESKISPLQLQLLDVQHTAMMAYIKVLVSRLTLADVERAMKK